VARLVRVRVVQTIEVPAAVGREVTDDLAPLGQQPPQVVGPGDAAGKAAGHADDGQRLVRGGTADRGVRCSGWRGQDAVQFG
jgi:hypothetical protein